MNITGFDDTIRWYNANARGYTDRTPETAEDKRQRDRFISLLPPKGSVLDAGCAAGRDSAWFAAQSFAVTGVDISRELIKLARSSHPQINFVQADLRALLFDTGVFDGVWAHASFVHFDTLRDAQTAFEECVRVLKPNGIFHLLVKAKTDNRDTAIVNDARSLHDRFFRYYDEQDIRELMSRHPLSPILLETYNEKDRGPDGRAEVLWTHVLMKKM